MPRNPWWALSLFAAVLSIALVAVALILAHPHHVGPHYLVLAVVLAQSSIIVFYGALIGRGKDERHADSDQRGRDQLFRDVFEQHDQVVAILTLEGVVLEVNAASLRTARVSRDEVLGRPFWETHWWLDSSAERQSQLQTAILDVVEGATSVRFNAEHARIDGTNTWLDVSIRPVLDTSDKVAYLVAESVDVTNKMQVMLQLSESESRMRAILEAAVDGIITIDSRGIIESFNRAAQEMFGHQADEVIGKNVDMLMPPPSREEHASYVDGYIGIGREVVGQRKDGTTFPLDLSVAEMHFGKGRRFTGILRDVTEKNRATENLRRSDSVLRRAQQLANIGSAQSSEPFGGDIAFWSDQAYRIYGRDPALGPPTAREYLEEIVHSEDRETVAKAHEEAVACARALDLEYRIRQPDGSIRSVHNVSVPECNEEDVVSWTICYHDLTDQRELEQEYRQAQKLEAVATLTSGIAHDYNNLLMGILGCTDLALKKLDADSPARMYLHEARNAAARGGSLTRQLLTFSRRRETAPTQFDINEVIESAEQIVRSLVGEQIDVAFNLASSDWRALGDRGLIEQVLMNLVVNARDAMPGGGELRIETSYRHLEAKAARRVGIKAGDWLMLQVADSGFGMDAKTKERVFEPFFTTKGLTQGTGLGLATVYGIIKGFDGKIVVDSEVARGTTFTIYLPRTTLAPEQVAAASAPKRRRSGSETILIVEDESLVRLTLRGYLEPLGYHILVACDVAEAIDLLGKSSEAIELLITDMMLPGGTGRQVADELLASRPNTPVIWMSAHPLDILEDQGLLPPEGHLLQKPFTEDELLNEVDSLLDHEGKRRAPSKVSILLVEDEDNARDATHELLSDLAYSVVSAKDGTQALRLARDHKAPLDVVLTDIGLPDLNGGELASMLRQQHPNVAIVYISGKSEHDPDVLRLLETSRTAFAQKPIDISALSDVIDTLVRAE